MNFLVLVPFVSVIFLNCQIIQIEASGISELRIRLKQFRTSVCPNCTVGFGICLRPISSAPTPPMNLFDKDHRTIKKHCAFGYERVEPFSIRPENINLTISFDIGFMWQDKVSVAIEAFTVKTTKQGGIPGNEGLISKHSLDFGNLVMNSGFQSGEEREAEEFISFEIGIKCHKNLYGKTCNRRCTEPKSESEGHQSCDDEGNVVCHKGYAKGPNELCTIPICDSCQNGTCISPNLCKCHDGFKGTSCEQCVKYPYCGAHGSCSKPWECNCDEGWGGLFCTHDLNFCTNHHPCQNGAGCQNHGNGSYQCDCKSGFSGQNCESKIETCQRRTCKNGGTCLPIKDGESFECKCRVGYAGRQCQFLASSCLDNPCQNAGTCVEDAKSGFRCECKYDMTGKVCDVEKNFCDSNPCQNEGDCFPAPSSSQGFRCLCKPGTKGPHCAEKIIYCRPGLCQNGGICTEAKSEGFQCNCQPGFLGSVCQFKNRVCIDTVVDCGHGYCEPTLIVGNYKCECDSGWEGDMCNVQQRTCNPGMCQNGGTCILNKCYCPACFSGEYCHVAMSKCISHVNSSAGIIRLPDTSEENPKNTNSDLSTLLLYITTPVSIVLLIILVVLVIALVLVCRRKQRKDQQQQQQQQQQQRNMTTGEDCVDGAGAHAEMQNRINNKLQLKLQVDQKFVDMEAKLPKPSPSSLDSPNAYTVVEMDRYAKFPYKKNNLYCNQSVKLHKDYLNTKSNCQIESETPKVISHPTPQLTVGDLNRHLRGRSNSPRAESHNPKHLQKHQKENDHCDRSNDNCS